MHFGGNTYFRNLLSLFQLKFYVFYSRPTGTINPANNRKFDHTDVVAEYRLAPNADVVDIKTERIILTQDKPDGNHDGSGIVFGADGYLYALDLK